MSGCVEMKPPAVGNSVTSEEHMATQVAADALGEEWKNCVGLSQWWVKETRFIHEPGVLIHGRVLLLLSKGQSRYRP